MFGWRYDTICPFCHHKFEACHGISSCVRIRGHGDLEYIDLWCPRCEKRYYRCLIDSFAFLQRMSGVKEDEAMNEAVKMQLCYHKSIENLIKCGLMDAIRNAYKEAYNIANGDLFVDSDLISSDDITITCACCY